MKNLLIIPLILVLASPVWAAEYTVCASGCDHTMIQAAFDGHDLSGDDMILVSAGTYHEKVIWGSNDLGTAGHPVNLVGIGQVIIDGDGVRDYGIDVRYGNYIRIYGIEVTDTTDDCIVGFFDYFTGANIDGAIFDNIYGHHCGGSGLGMATWYRSGYIKGIEITNSRFEYNGAAGIGISGHVDGVAITGTICDYNGALEATGVMAFGARTKHVTTGWTSDGGGIYHRVVTLDNADYRTVYRAMNTTDGQDLAENTATPSTPAAGEFGSATAAPWTLWIHLPADADPEGKDIMYAFTKCTNITITDSITSNQQRPASAEGHGLMADDMTDNLTAIRHKSFLNAGSNYTLNAATNCSLINVVGYDAVNGDGGWFGPYSHDNTVYNGTFADNTGAGWYWFVPNDGNTVINSVMVDNGTYGQASNGTPTNYTSHHNATYGNVSGHTSNITDVGPVTTDPLLDSQGRPALNSPVMNAGTDVGLSFWGSAPEIGAYEIGGYPIKINNLPYTMPIWRMGVQ